jgi:hypothetical protein
MIVHVVREIPGEADKVQAYPNIKEVCVDADNAFLSMSYDGLVHTITFDSYVQDHTVEQRGDVLVIS